MAQGIFGGATSYEEQSLNDILEDVEKWIEYTDKRFEKIRQVLPNCPTVIKEAE